MASWDCANAQWSVQRECKPSISIIKETPIVRSESYGAMAMDINIQQRTMKKEVSQSSANQFMKVNGKYKLNSFEFNKKINRGGNCLNIWLISFN